MLRACEPMRVMICFVCCHVYLEYHLNISKFSGRRLAQQMTQAVVEFDQPVALDNRRIALGHGVQRQRPQRIDIVGERIQPTVSRAKHSTLQAHLPEPSWRLIHGPRREPDASKASMIERLTVVIENQGSAVDPRNPPSARPASTSTWPTGRGRRRVWQQSQQLGDVGGEGPN